MQYRCHPPAHHAGCKRRVDGLFTGDSGDTAGAVPEIPMTESPPAQPVAVELLQDLGMNQYEAAIYVAFLRLGGGTARKMSEITSVPRTRIYDAVECLQDRGPVDVQNNSPKQFQPVGRETTLRHFRHKYDDTVTELAS